MHTDCILCGGCADICPVGCIEIIPMKESGLETMSRTRLVNRFAGEYDIPLDQQWILIKREADCIRCGLCVKQCPVGVMVMTYEEGSLHE